MTNNRAKITTEKLPSFAVLANPLALQQYMLLQRNLVYTGITRSKKWWRSSGSERLW
jgi:ATP-dependent exoDNAse (exonuclease V) alpha subunit